MRGNLNPDSLARVIRGLAVSRKQGVLHLSRNGVSKRIYFKEGWIVFADSDDEQERLGELLVRAGKLKRSDLEFALKVARETGESFGKTIVEMGFVTLEDLETRALQRTKAIIGSVFAWPSGQFYFEERDASVKEGTAVRLSPTETIVDGVCGIEDPEVARRGLGELDAVLRRPEISLLPYDEGGLGCSAEWILHKADGVFTIKEIVANSPLDEIETLNSIYGFVAAGVLEVQRPGEAPAVGTVEGTRVSGGNVVSKGKAVRPVSRDSSSVPLPGKLGRYEVQKVLGRGAMGAVYLARDPAIDRTVAVKLVQTAVQLSPGDLKKYRERFYREAKAAGKLLHPGIVTVFDVGHTEEQTPFIVMEYVEGKTLQEIIETEKLDVQEVLRLSEQILEALAYAHRHGVVHRDIKPPNILVTVDGQPKIMDFGIAHVAGSDLTQAGDVLGSPSYMAPEQLSKGTVDPRTDLFAYGVVLYRMLTGALPFTGDSFAVIAKGIIFEDPTPPETLDSKIPAALALVVKRCLAKDPAERYASAAELKNALASMGGGSAPDTEMARSFESPASRSGSTPAPDAVHRPTRDGATPHGTRYAASKSRISSSAIAAKVLAVRKPKVAFAAGAAFLVIIISLGFVFYRGPSKSESPPPKDMATTAGMAEPSRPAPVDVGTPSPGAAPDTAVPEPLLQPGDVALYDEARVAFERGDLQASKESLEKLLKRNPGFEDAPELLVKVNERLRNEDPGVSGAAAPPEPAPVSAPSNDATEGQLFYEARLAFENGDIEGSQSRLETLLRGNPSFAGATELLVAVRDEIWKRSLPMSFRAKHNHRIGSCRGTLTLARWGIRFHSDAHAWDWSFEEIRLMERTDQRSLSIQTQEKDVLDLGRYKNYRFELQGSLSDEDWSRYQRLAQ